MGDLIGFLIYGAAIGLSLGLTGGGGSIIAVPLLVYAVGQPVHDAIGTSLAIVGGIALQGALRARMRVRWRIALLLSLCGLGGTVAGSILAHHVSSRALLLAFGGVMVIAAIMMLRSRTPQSARVNDPHPARLIIAGIVVGVLTGFLGVGGGFLIVPALVVGLGIPMSEAIPTSLFVIFLNSLVSVATRASYAGIDWHIAIPFLIGGYAGNLAGGAIAAHLDQRRLKQVFAGFVLLVGAFTTASVTGVLHINVK